MTSVVFAAGLDWLESLLPALFVGFWILSQVFAVFRRVPQGHEPVVVVKPMPLEGQPVATSEQLHKEIEEFLLGRRRSTPKHERRKARPSNVGRTSSEPRQPTPAPPQAATSIDVPVPPVIDTDVARHVDEAFAHDLAHTVPAGRGENATAHVSPTASRPSLAALLRDPATIRQIFVMREVLERPTERWR